MEDQIVDEYIENLKKDNPKMVKFEIEESHTQRLAPKKHNLVDMKRATKSRAGGSRKIQGYIEPEEPSDCEHEPI